MIRAMIITILLATLISPGLSEEKLPKAKQVPEPYFGLQPPGQIGERFAAGIIEVDGIQHCHPTFSPDGTEVYWAKMNRTAAGVKSEIWFMDETEDGWTEPAIASFSGEYLDQNPCFSHDGTKIYFSTIRPGASGKGRNINFVKRTENGWDEPVNLGTPPNSDIGVSQASFTIDGTIYFVGRKDSVEWNCAIYRSRLVDGQYHTPEELSNNINTEFADSYPFIAPDESFLLFCSSRPGGNSPETDLYISLKSNDGSFGEPIHIGPEINNGKTIAFPSLTPDGKYLIYLTFGDDGSGDMTDLFYWIDAGILDQYINLK